MNDHKILTRDAILRAPDLATEAVEVPEWGGTVKVRALSAAERDAFEVSLFEGQGADRRRNFDYLRAKLVALCVADDDGHRIFSDADAEALGMKNAAALDRIFVVAQRLNGLGARNEEALEKN